MYNLECIKDNDTYAGKNITCKVNQLKNGMYTVSMFGDLIVELNYMLMNFYLTHKTSQRTLVNVTMEYCSVYGNFPLIVRLAIEFTKKFTNDMIHACPYTPRKKLGVENFPTNELSNKALNVFSDRIKIERGDYFAAYNVKDRKRKIIFNFKSLVTISQKRLKSN